MLIPRSSTTFYVSKYLPLYNFSTILKTLLHGRKSAIYVYCKHAQNTVRTTNDAGNSQTPTVPVRPGTPGTLTFYSDVMYTKFFIFRMSQYPLTFSLHELRTGQCTVYSVQYISTSTDTVYRFANTLPYRYR